MQAGKADTMIAVGAESALCPIVIYSLANAKALSKNNENPQTASRPFDITRDGFVIGEGGGGTCAGNRRTCSLLVVQILSAN